MKILIVTQDIATITSLKGVIGKIYAFWVINLEKLKLFIILKLFSSSSLTLITSRELYVDTNKQVLFWDQLLSQNHLDQERSRVWQIINQLISPAFQNIKYLNLPLLKVWETYLAIHLSHSILAYYLALNRLSKSYRPDKIIIIGSSFQEQIAGFISHARKIKLLNLSFLNFSGLNQKLLDWLFLRQLILKSQTFINDIIKPVKLIKPGSFLSAVSFHRHLQTLIPLQRELTKKKLDNTLIIDNVETACLLGENNDYCFINSFLDKDQATKLYRTQQKIGQNNLSKIKSFSRPDSIQQLAVNLLNSYLNALLSHAFPLVCLYLSASDRLISTVKPRGIFLVSDARPLEMSLGLLAKKYKIPSLLVSPNTILSLDAVNQYSLADKIAVVGSNIKKQLIRIGVPEGKINLVGDLRFETVTPETIANYRQKVYRLLNFSLGTKLFLLISFRSNPQIPLVEKRQFFKIASQAIKKIPNTQLIVKPHPTETSAQVQAQIRQWGITNALVTNNQELELIELLAACQAVFITWSMSGFEAIVMEKPVVVINSTSKNYDKIIPYVIDKGALIVKNSLELHTILKQLISDKDFLNTQKNQGQTFIKKYILSSDGQVADRIIQLIARE